MSNILRQRLEAGQSVYADHPAADTLAAFIEHSLKNTERDKVLSHLSACSECRQAVLLAVPEVAEAVRVQVPHSSRWYFPTAMRWASLTAAVAVAVGVGMISYEHEFGTRTSNSAESMPQNVAKEQKSEVAPPAPTPQATLQDSFGKDQPKPATVREPKIAESKSEPSSKLLRKDMNKTLELDQKAQVRDSSAGVLGGIVSRSRAQSSDAVDTELAKQQSSARANFANEAPIEQSPVPSRNESSMLKALPAVTAAAPAPASQPASAWKSGTSGFADNNALQAKSADSSIAQTVTSASGSGYFDAKTPVPAKAPGFTALGSVKKSAAAVTEFASWTVTAAGKLQRRLRDGAVNFIEPAPGLIVHAVAARGIEVWAGGSQPDAPKQGPQSALFHSSDAGESWKQVSGPWHGPINQLALSGSDTLTVITDDGTWVSKDAGGSWTNR